MASDGTIGNWSPTQLQRWLRDMMENDPPRFLQGLKVDTLDVVDELTVEKKVSFLGQQFHSVGGTGEPAFKNSWVNFGAGWAAASFVKKPDGWVQLHGIVSNPTNPLTLPSTIFTLPPGYWPEASQVWPRIANNLIARIDLNATGDVQAVVPTNTAAPWITLEGISFKAKSNDT